MVLILVGILGGMFFLSKKTSDSIYYVQTKSGEELLCWDGGCGWNRGSTVGDLNLTPPNVPAIVGKDILPSDIVEKKKILDYRHDEKQTFSSLKGFIVKGDKVVFALRDFDKSTVYVWDNLSDKTKTIVSSAESMWPIDLHPEGNLVLVAESNSSDGQITETIYSLEDNKKSGSMRLSSFRWGEGEKYLGSEYLGFDAKLTEYECPYYADIHNCGTNERRSKYWAEVEKQANALDFNWISLSLPSGWDYIVNDNSIQSRNMVFLILAGPTKQNLLGNLSTCYLLQSSRQGNSANGKMYQVTQYINTKRCEDSFHDKVFVIRHKEFGNSSLVLEATSLDLSATQSQINNGISQFVSSLPKSILY